VQCVRSDHLIAVLHLQAGTPLWPAQDVVPASGYVAVSPYPAGPRAVAVASPEELRGAMAAGAQHIVIKEHLDLTFLAEAGAALPVPTGTETIRVRVSDCGFAHCLPTRAFNRAFCYEASSHCMLVS
jgi:hypothetical protein